MSTETFTSIYAPRAEHNGDYLSVQQIMKHNDAIGHNFFSVDAMRFFNSKVYNDLHLGHYFITSERDRYDDRRAYTIRYADGTGDVSTFSKFCEFASLRSARVALKKIGA